MVVLRSVVKKTSSSQCGSAFIYKHMKEFVSFVLHLAFSHQYQDQFFSNQTIERYKEKDAVVSFKQDKQSVKKVSNSCFVFHFNL